MATKLHGGNSITCIDFATVHAMIVATHGAYNLLLPK